MAMATTTVKIIRARLASLIERIVSREEHRRDERFVWRDGQEIVGRLRNFDIIVSPEIETPGGAYSEGLEYQAIFAIRVAYQGDAEEVRRLAGSDSIDLAALLVQLHEFEGGIEGMFPVDMSARRGLPLLIPTWESEEEGAQICQFQVEIHFFAPDRVTIGPAPT